GSAAPSAAKPELSTSTERMRATSPWMAGLAGRVVVTATQPGAAVTETPMGSQSDSGQNPNRSARPWEWSPLVTGHSSTKRSAAPKSNGPAAVIVNPNEAMRRIVEFPRRGLPRLVHGRGYG